MDLTMSGGPAQSTVFAAALPFTLPDPYHWSHTESPTALEHLSQYSVLETEPGPGADTR